MNPYQAALASTKGASNPWGLLTSLAKVAEHEDVNLTLARSARAILEDLEDLEGWPSTEQVSEFITNHDSWHAMMLEWQMFKVNRRTAPVILLLDSIHNAAKGTNIEHGFDKWVEAWNVCDKLVLQYSEQPAVIDRKGGDR